MGRIGLAFKYFFSILFHAETARKVARLEGPPAVEPEPAPQPPSRQRAEPPPPSRSEALTLLETLQREARLIDFIQEDLDGYSDAQVGAAVREVHRECRNVLQRLFAISPLVDQPEGTAYEVTEQDVSARIRLTGQVTESRPVRGTLVHTGWRADRCDLPRWSGADEYTSILAPAEVELS
jgi:hypothetical protein